MTVMPVSGEVADKAVSTEDASSSNVEVARLEAVLAALVETKVESMKASASTTTRRVGSAPASPRRPRLTSSSTASSSQNHYHHHHHHHHHHHNSQQNNNHHHHHHHNGHNDHKHDKKKQDDRKHRRHDSAPCGEFIGVTTAGGLTDQTDRQRTKYGKGHRRDSEQPKSPRKRRRHSRSPQGPPGLRNVLEDPGPESGLALLGIDRDQQLDLLNFERTRETFGENRELPRLQQSSCCFSQSATQLKIHYDVDDYVALNLEDELEDEEDSHNDPKKRRGPCDKYHRPKRKRKRRRRRIDPGETPEELADPEELPPRARWTIVATACLLLAMSLLLVGVTLRMAPIIDDMGDGRRASVCRKNRPKRGSTVRRKGSIRGNAGNVVATPPEVVKIAIPPIGNHVDIAQDRSRRKIVIIVLSIFIFLLVASILVVVITLTHSSFHSLPADPGKESDDPQDK